jgi:hypothetical protein
MGIQKTKCSNSNGIIITKQSKQDLFEINGNIYESTTDFLCKKGTIIPDMNYKFDVYRDKFSNYVLCKSESYPCFDSSDRMYEHRFYRSYMICASKDEAIEKYKYIIEHNPDCRANENTPSFLAPLVYADDGTSMIYIMTVTTANNDLHRKVKAPFWNKLAILRTAMKKKLLI